MLKAEIALADLRIDPACEGGAIVWADSRITPYPHRLLETLLVRTPGQWFMVTRERQAATAASVAISVRDVGAEEFNQLYRACLLWPLDYVLIEAAQAGCRLRVRAGVFGSVPVYARAFDDRLRLSWDPDDLLVGSLALDVEMASHRLALHSVYSARQLCVGITLLTERASLHVEPGKLRYSYPAPAEDTVPAPLPPGRDALAMFDEQLRHAVSARPLTAGRIAAELSGGMDSATVACALAAAHSGVASLGTLLDGDARQAQVQRRWLIADTLGLRDCTVDIAAYPPRVDMEPLPGQPARFYWEYYLEASTALWNLARGQGCDVLFTGIGGDELFPSYLDEAHEDSEQALEAAYRRCAEQLLTPRAWSASHSQRLFDAPASPVPMTALLAHACRAPDMLRGGLWPINPLSNPGLADFCHRLPREHRRQRAVMKQYLQARLSNDVFSRSYVKESFAYLLPQQVAAHSRTLAAQLRECALADLGVVRHQAALELLEQVATTQAETPMAVLAAFLWLERLARRVA